MPIDLEDVLYGVGGGLQDYATAANDSNETTTPTGYTNSASPAIVEETTEDFTIYYILGGLVILIIGIALYLKFK